ncbi:hypothetical protein Hdeb2414_s0023g00637931 [Helianthus debilis subsp. tardiflorus]
MHLWPSERLRDSFKLGYLNNLEWNLRRMKTTKNNNKNQSAESSNEDKLLGDDTTDAQNCDKKNRFSGCVVAVARDLLMIFSCCFCCGACVD